MASHHWPLFDLRLRTERLELRPDWDEGLALLLDVALDGIHNPATMPFSEPWTDLERGGPFERGFFQWHWRQRAEWTPEKWQLVFLVLLDGQPVGTQGLSSQRFGQLGVVETGSWLGQRFQGRGIGKEMRSAVLHLAFAGLGARRALSGAFHDNAASLGVSRHLGYVNNGEELHLRRTEPDRIIRLLLTREAWEASPRPDVAIEGLAPCLALFGTGAATAP